MDPHKRIDPLQLCTHLKTQWTPLDLEDKQPHQFLYQHAFSSDQTQAIHLSSVSMKDLDHYSSRQAYSFPFCPKIYKYIIKKNQQKGNELMFDIVLLVERIVERLDSMKRNPKIIKMLSQKVLDVVGGLKYLFRRVGPFSIIEEMIGWTELGVVKVWFNDDFSSNNKKQQVETQQQMIDQLVTILQDKSLLKKPIKKCTTFQNLISHIQATQDKKEMDYLKKQVAFRPIDNLNASVNDYRPEGKFNKMFQNVNSPLSTQSKKNITFSYSNKDLHKEFGTKQMKKSNKIAASKRCSIQMDDNQLSRVMKIVNHNETSVLTVGSKTPSASISSNKLLNPPIIRNPKKKLSVFHQQYSKQYQQPRQQMTVQKFKEHFSKTTQSSVNKKQLQANQLHKNSRTTPQSLHYSTSSNPLSKFFRPKRTQEKTYSIKGNSEGQSRQDQSYIESRSKNGSNSSQFSYQAEVKVKEEAKGHIQTFKIEQQQANLRQSQEVKKDLDALFNSQNSVNYEELQNELDCIL